jgi:hypothetical protein
MRFLPAFIFSDAFSFSRPMPRTELLPLPFRTCDARFARDDMAALQDLPKNPALFGDEGLWLEQLLKLNLYCFGTALLFASAPGGYRKRPVLSQPRVFAWF